jgi:hypothetical protein
MFTTVQPIANYTNVFFDPNSTYSFAQLNEREYILNVLEQLQMQLGSGFNDFCFILFSANGEQRKPASIDQSFPGKKKVLFYLSDESGKTASELEGYFYRIFKSYLPYTNNNNIYPFPLGHVNNIHFERNEIKIISTREIPFFFSGNLNINRIDFFKQFSSLSIPVFLLRQLIRIPFIKKQLIKSVKKEYIPNSFINFTTGFKDGLPPDEYKKCLLNSKIVFCPKGFISTETFRHLEAMAAGCVVISEKLPETALYKDCPIIQVSNWKEGIIAANKLLSDTVGLDELQKSSIDFWQKNYSDTAIAKYVGTHLL